MPPVARCRTSTYLSPNGVSLASDGAGRLSLAIVLSGATQSLAERRSRERVDRSLAGAQGQGMAVGGFGGQGERRGAEQRFQGAGGALGDAVEIVAAFQNDHQ